MHVPLLLLLAWRNLLRHRGKSILIGSIVFLGSLLLTLGNGVVAGMESGLAENIVKGFTGHIVLVSDKQKSDDVFISFQMPSIAPLYNYSAIEPLLERQPGIERFVPVGKNCVMVIDEENGSLSYTNFAYVLGVEFEKYQQAFGDNLTALEGRLPSQGERFVLVAAGRRKEFYRYSGIWFFAGGDSVRLPAFREETGKAGGPLYPKSDMVCLGLTPDNSGTDIRCDIRAIIRYRALNHMFTFGNFVVMDIESYQDCMGYSRQGEFSGTLDEKDAAILAMGGSGLDSLFGTPSPLLDPKPRSGFDRAAGARIVDAPNEPVYNMVLVVLSDALDVKRAVRQLNDTLAAHGTGVRAIAWNNAVAAIGSMSAIVKGVVTVFVLLLFAVACLIIVNTLGAAVIERTPEIATMRALGAQRSSVRAIILAEVETLCLVSGLAGIGAGAAAIATLAAIGITTQNDVLQLLFGGERFAPLFRGADLVVTLVELAGIAAVAALYPMVAAGRISATESPGA